MVGWVMNLRALVSKSTIKQLAMTGLGEDSMEAHITCSKYLPWKLKKVLLRQKLRTLSWEWRVESYLVVLCCFVACCVQCLGQGQQELR